MIFEKPKSKHHYLAVFLQGIFFFISFLCTAQINLVQNPSFEQISSCPTGFNQINKALYWDTLKMGGGCGPELMNSCANITTGVGAPVNGGGYQWPRTGNSYGSFSAYTSSFNLFEYIQNKLLQTLGLGKTYCITWYVNLTNRSKYAIDEYGAYLDNGSISTGWCQPAIVIPQVKSATGVYLTDTLGWMKIQGLYTATGNEKYLTLGNFRNNIQTNNILFNSSASGQVAEYSVDDVSIIDISTPAFAGNNVYIAIGDSAYIGRPREIGLDDDCTWYILGNATPIGTAAGLWVKPAALGTYTYTVKQNICGTIKYDTVKVFVTMDGVDELGMKDAELRIYPSPASTIMNVALRQAQGDDNVEVKITDAMGQIVFKQNLQVRTGICTFNVNELAEGIYFINIQNSGTNQSVTKKLIISK